MLIYLTLIMRGSLPISAMPRVHMASLHGQWAAVSTNLEFTREPPHMDPRSTKSTFATMVVSNGRND